jgi:cob(I)alamin adenosyltransferase
MRPYHRHLLICEHGTCADPEAAAQLQQQFRALAKPLGLTSMQNPARIKCTLTDCLGVCRAGPIVVVYPDGIWYHNVDATVLERIVNQHLIGGEPVEEYIFYRQSDNPPPPEITPNAGQTDVSPEDSRETALQANHGQPGSNPDAEARRIAARVNRKQKGLLIVNTGHGKGKTTAAFGILTRAWGRDMRVGGIQFFKHENANYGELRAFERMGISVTPMGDGWTWTSRDIDETQAKALHGWEVAKTQIVSGNYDLFLLDEFTYVLHFGWLDPVEVVSWIHAHKPPMLHLIITGRDAPEVLIEAADLVTEMREIKHPFRDQGIKAQKGVEF